VRFELTEGFPVRSELLRTGGAAAVRSQIGTTRTAPLDQSSFLHS
jgi:hypothetical protein